MSFQFLPYDISQLFFFSETKFDLLIKKIMTDVWIVARKKNQNGKRSERGKEDRTSSNSTQGLREGCVRPTGRRHVQFL